MFVVLLWIPWIWGPSIIMLCYMLVFLFNTGGHCELCPVVLFFPCVYTLCSYNEAIFQIVTLGTWKLVILVIAGTEENSSYLNIRICFRKIHTWKLLSIVYINLSSHQTSSTCQQLHSHFLLFILLHFKKQFLFAFPARE